MVKVNSSLCDDYYVGVFFCSVNVHMASHLGIKDINMAPALEASRCSCPSTASRCHYISLCHTSSSRGNRLYVVGAPLSLEDFLIASNRIVQQYAKFCSSGFI